MSTRLHRDGLVVAEALHERGLLHRGRQGHGVLPPLRHGAVRRRGRARLPDRRGPERLRAVPDRGGRPTPRSSGASLLVWTTTPWTLPVEHGRRGRPRRATTSIVDARRRAADRRRSRCASACSATAATVVRTVAGSELVGARYEPPYPNVEDAHRVVAGRLRLDGRRHRHRAPRARVRPRGPRDRPRSRAGRSSSRSATTGRFTDLAPGVRARPVREGRRPEDRRGPPRSAGCCSARGRYEHSYPFCWRCRTPLLYYARTSWYVRTTAVKDRLLAVNEEVELVSPTTSSTGATATGSRTTSTGRSPASGTGARRCRSGGARPGT